MKRKMISYYMIQNVVLTTISCVITVLLILMFKANLMRFYSLIEIAVPLVFIYLYLKAILAPIIEAKTFTFEITKQRFAFKKGVYKKTTVMIPMHRIQHVTTMQTILSDQFDVSKQRLRCVRLSVH